MASCNCGAEIFWRKHTVTKVPAPLNMGPDPTGNLRLEGDHEYALVPKAERADFLAAGGILFRPHYADCPNAPTFRKTRVKVAR